MTWLARLQGAAVEEVRAEAARFDDDHLDAERLHLGPQRLGQPFDGELGRPVDPPAGHLSEAAHRAQVQDPAGPLCPHDRQHGPGHGQQPEHVGLKHRLNLVRACLLDGAEETPPGVVDQDFDPAECADRRACHRGARR
jgi:hypothetical protein